MNNYLQSQYQHAQTALANADFNLAEKTLLDLIARYPNISDLYNLLGVVYTSMKNFIDGKRAFEKALEIKPDFAIANACYAKLCIDFNLYHKARNHLELAIKQNSEIPEFYINLSQLYIDSELFEESKMLCENALKKFHNLLPILNNLGISNLNLNLINEAEDSFKKALEFNPNFIDAQINLGCTYLEKRDFKKSISYLKYALSLDSNNAMIYKAFANFYAKFDFNFNKSIKYIKKAIKVNKDSSFQIGLYSDLFNYYSFIGNKNELNNALKYLMSTNQPNIYLRSFYHQSLNGSIKSLDSEEVIKAKKMKSLTNNPVNEAYFYFAISHICSLKKDYKEASKNIIIGNKFLNKFYQSKKSFNEDKLIQHRYKLNIIKSSLIDFMQVSCKVDDKFNPILIVGMPRSGSTLLEQILSSHSLVGSVGELSFISENNLEQDYFNLIKNNDVKNLKNFINNFRNIYKKRVKTINKNVNYFIDKTLNNYLFVNLFISAFPNCKIIHISRDKKSNAFSIYKNIFQLGIYTWTANLKSILSIYNDQKELSNYYFNKFPKNYLNIKYEDLIHENELWVKTIIHFLGIDFEESCLEHHKNTNTVRTLSKYQVREKIYSKSINEWKKYIEFLPELNI